MLEASHSSQADDEVKKRACGSGFGGVASTFLVWPGGADGGAGGERVGDCMYRGLVVVASLSVYLGFCLSSDGFAYGVLSSGLVDDRSWRGIVKDISERVGARLSESTVSEADKAMFTKSNAIRQKITGSQMAHFWDLFMLALMNVSWDD